MKFKTYKLKDCIELIIDHRGKTPKKLGGDWKEKGVPVISAKNVKNGELKDIEQIRFIDVEIYEKWMKNPIEKGDVLIASEGATLGENMLWDSEKKVALGQRLYAVRANKDVMYDKYFAEFVNTIFFQNEIKSRSTGTSVLGIKQIELLNTKVILPSIEQQKIVGDLGFSIQKKIGINKNIISQLEQLSQTLFKHWFIDFEFPNEQGQPYKSSGGEMVESELGEIPKGFEIKSIYEIANIIYGAAFSSKLFNEEKIGLPLVRIRDLKTGNPQFYTDEEHKKATIIKTGDLLIGMDAEFTPTIWKGVKSYLNQRVCLVIPTQKYIHKMYLYYAVQPYMRFLENSKVGTTVIHLSKSDFDKMKVIIPSIYLLKKYSNVVNEMYDKLINLYNENRNLKELRDTLLPKLLSGEIEIPDELEVK